MLRNTQPVRSQQELIFRVLGPLFELGRRGFLLSGKQVLKMLNTAEKLDESTLQAPKSGAEIVVDVLNELGVDYIFGHTGGAIIPLHVEFNTRMERKEKTPHFILCRQESGAGHAAEGYARVSGKVGVALATSGPGSTNLVTPIADAYKDSIPCVFITGQVPSTMIGNDAFQEVDMVGITRPISKHNYLVRHAEDLDGVLRQAFYIAQSGRPGPVVVDICKNALLGKVTNGHKVRTLKSYHPDVKMDQVEAYALLTALLKATKPVIKVGGGVISADASMELRQFVDKYQIPVAQTFMGLGALNHDHPLFLGMPGMHGMVAANYALRDADFILAIGSRFDDRVAVREFGRGITVAHVDIDHAEISKNIPTKFELCANAREFLQYGIDADLEGVDIAPWLHTLNVWKEKYAMRYDHDSELVKPQQVVEELSRLTNKNAIMVTGVGQHQNVGGAVLQLSGTAPVGQFRWSGHDGFRPACGHRRLLRQSRQDHSMHRR